jgi:uncharacterized cupredoxin-like copper-binding protein
LSWQPAWPAWPPLAAVAAKADFNSASVPKILENLMSEKLNSSQRWLQAAAISLALLGAAALPSLAAAQQIGQPESAVESTDALTVVRDAETGKLRAATGQETQTMSLAAKAKSMLRVAPAATLQKYHRNGARGTRLTDEFMSSAVVVRNPDGSLTRECLEPGHSELGVHSHTQANQPVTE